MSNTHHASMTEAEMGHICIVLQTVHFFLKQEATFGNQCVQYNMTFKHFLESIHVCPQRISEYIKKSSLINIRLGDCFLKQNPSNKHFTVIPSLGPQEEMQQQALVPSCVLGSDDS